MHRLFVTVSAVSIVLAACGSSEPQTPEEAMQATWDSFTDDQQQEACASYEESQVRVSQYLTERAVAKFPQFVEGDLYSASNDLNDVVCPPLISGR